MMADGSVEISEPGKPYCDACGTTKPADLAPSTDGFSEAYAKALHTGYLKAEQALDWRTLTPQQWAGVQQWAQREAERADREAGRNERTCRDSDACIRRREALEVGEPAELTAANERCRQLELELAAAGDQLQLTASSSQHQQPRLPVLPGSRPEHWDAVNWSHAISGGNNPYGSLSTAEPPAGAPSRSQAGGAGVQPHTRTAKGRARAKKTALKRRGRRRMR